MARRRCLRNGSDTRASTTSIRHTTTLTTSFRTWPTAPVYSARISPRRTLALEQAQTRPYLPQLAEARRAPVESDAGGARSSCGATALQGARNGINASETVRNAAENREGSRRVCECGSRLRMLPRKVPYDKIASGGMLLHVGRKTCRGTSQIFRLLTADCDEPGHAQLARPAGSEAIARS